MVEVVHMPIWLLVLILGAIFGLIGYSYKSLVKRIDDLEEFQMDTMTVEKHKEVCELAKSGLDAKFESNRELIQQNREAVKERIDLLERNLMLMLENKILTAIKQNGNGKKE